jgi:hypothetical protein
LLILAAAAAFASGCGGDDENDPSSTTQTAQAPATVTETVTAPPATTEEQQPTTTEETPTAPPDDGVCQDGAGNEIELLAGDGGLHHATRVANGYDSQGDRVQEVGEFICEGGNAQTRPIIFTCTGPGGEFTVSES